MAAINMHTAMYMIMGINTRRLFFGYPYYHRLFKDGLVLRLFPFVFQYRRLNARGLYAENGIVELLYKN